MPAPVYTMKCFEDFIREARCDAKEEMRAGESKCSIWGMAGAVRSMGVCRFFQML